jgi:hypothetical protein
MGWLWGKFMSTFRAEIAPTYLWRGDDAIVRSPRPAKVPTMTSDDLDSQATSAPSAPWLGAVLVTAFGFLPLGIFAVLMCIRTDRAQAAGDLTAAAAAAKSARRLVWITVVVAVIVDIAVIGVLLALGAFSSR